MICASALGDEDHGEEAHMRSTQPYWIIRLQRFGKFLPDIRHQLTTTCTQAFVPIVLIFMKIQIVLRSTSICPYLITRLFNRRLHHFAVEKNNFSMIDGFSPFLNSTAIELCENDISSLSR